MPGRIPQNFIDDLLSRIDIVDVIDTFVPLRKAGKNHQARCPFHEEKTPSFTVSQDKQFYHCFGCGAHGTAITFLMEYNNNSFPEAVEELATRCGLEIPREASYTPASNENAELHELLELVIQYYKTQLREHKEAQRAVSYLKQRGISGEIAATYELGFAPPGWDNLITNLGKSEAAQSRLARAGMIINRDQGGFYDRFRDRIMFPIRDQRGRAIGFGGRVLADDTPKYLNTPETPVFHKGRELYGLYQARNRDKNLAEIYIVEGYMDVIALAQYEVGNAVATLGTAATGDHVERLFRNTSRVVFCFDGDDAGKAAAWRALENTLPHLREGREARFLFLPQGDDPDSYVRREGATAFIATSQQVPLSDFLINSLSVRADMETREGRARLLDQVIPYLNRLPGSGFREVLIEDVARQCQVDRGTVETMLAGQPPVQQQRGKRQPRTQTAENRQLIGNIISYLLSRPSLAALVDDVDSLSKTKVAGVDFLMELLELLHHKPDIHCAAILEHYRDHAYGQRLSELATGSDVLDEDGFDIERQFLDAMDRLRDRQDRRQLEDITGKSLSDLSEAEKEAIRERISSMKST